MNTMNTMNTAAYDVCDVCATIGGYCGGSGHPSCGCFENGVAVPAKKLPKVVNLTPHDITVSGITYPKSGTVARVSMETTITKSPLPGVPVFRQKMLGVIDLPDPIKGTIFLVSGFVISALNGTERNDVFAPDTGPKSVIRDANGQIIGVSALVAP